MGIAWRSVVMTAAVHVAAAVGVWVYGVSLAGVALAVALYALRMFAISAGVHRYFAHRSFETSRAMELGLAFVATSSVQLGAMWWASQHRLHHRHADGPGDPHDRRRGFWWSHGCWAFMHRNCETRWDQMRDFADDRALRWLDRHYLVPVAVLIAVLLAAGGVWALVWGFCVSTVVLWHATFTLTSVVHAHGSRRYAIEDDSRNNAIVALATFGEGWHNNHHYYPGSARHGFFWWELDVSYLGLRALEAVGLVWNLRVVPAEVRDRRLA
jgi:stearoyl-CoA desaturase (delta-9 desaturase)